MKETQMDLIQKQQLLLDEKTKQMAVETIGKAITNSLLGKRSNKMDEEISILKSKGSILAQYGAEAAESQIAKTRAQTTFTLDENERQAAINAPNIAVAIERVALMRTQGKLNEQQMAEIKQRIEIMKKTGQLQDWEISLNKKGISKSDPWYIRTVATGVEKLIGGGSLLKQKPYQSWHGKPNPNYDPKNPQSKMFLPNE